MDDKIAKGGRPIAYRGEGMRDAAGRGKESRGKVASSGFPRSFQRLSLILPAASVDGASGIPWLLERHISVARRRHMACS